MSLMDLLKEVVVPKSAGEENEVKKVVDKSDDHFVVDLFQESHFRSASCLGTHCHRFSFEDDQPNADKGMQKQGYHQRKAVLLMRPIADVRRLLFQANTVDGIFLVLKWRYRQLEKKAGPKDPGIDKDVEKIVLECSRIFQPEDKYVANDRCGVEEKRQGSKNGLASEDQSQAEVSLKWKNSQLSRRIVFSLSIHQLR